VATRQSALDDWVLPAIALVKAGKTAQAGLLLAQAITQMQADGANGIILACTEAPMALEHASPAVQDICLDSTQALAQATVAMWQQLQNQDHKDVRHV
jgi:aspartate racemase